MLHRVFFSSLIFVFFGVGCRERDLGILNSATNTPSKFENIALKVGGSTSSSVIADFDQDGMVDLAMLVAPIDKRFVEIQVRWGDKDHKWKEVSSFKVLENYISPNTALAFRDSSTSLSPGCTLVAKRKVRNCTGRG